MQTISFEQVTHFFSTTPSWVALVLCLMFILSISAYVKIVTILAIIRVGFGTSSIPTALITGILAFGLSFFVMYPVIQDSVSRVNINNQKITEQDLNLLLEPWKNFVLSNVDQEMIDKYSEIAFKVDAQYYNYELNEYPQFHEFHSNSWRVLVPAFLVSELSKAFATGLLLFLPFLIIDLLIASLMSAMTIQGLSVQAVSFPFKILLFVMVDGWTLLTGNMLLSFT